MEKKDTDFGGSGDGKSRRVIRLGVFTLVFDLTAISAAFLAFGFSSIAGNALVFSSAIGTLYLVTLRSKATFNTMIYTLGAGGIIGASSPYLVSLIK